MKNTYYEHSVQFRWVFRVIKSFLKANSNESNVSCNKNIGIKKYIEMKMLLRNIL